MEVRVSKLENSDNYKIIVTPQQYVVLKNSIEKYNKQRESARVCARRQQEAKAAKAGKILKPFVETVANRVLLVEDFQFNPIASCPDE